MPLTQVNTPSVPPPNNIIGSPPKNTVDSSQPVSPSRSTIDENEAALQLVNLESRLDTPKKSTVKPTQRTTPRKSHHPSYENKVLKPCKCKNSKCLKLYCDCFRARVFL
jgi:hypothetical protein